MAETFYGGMENHGYYMKQYFKGHNQYPLLGVILKDISGYHHIHAPNGRIIHPFISIDFLIDFLVKKSGSHRAICFFNSGHWIEDIYSLRSALPGATFLQRTGGNEFLKAPLSKSCQKIEERQHIWANIINSNIDIVISNSIFTSNRLSSCGIRPNKIIEVKGGVDKKLCTLSKSQRLIYRNKFFRDFSMLPCIICASRLVSFKGIDILIYAIREVLNFKDVALFIIGDGPMKKELEEIAQTLIPDRCRFVGALSPNISVKAIAASDLLCCLSRYERRNDLLGGEYVHTETMGRSVYEAIACGIPVVASNVGGLPEVCKQPFGTIVQENNITQSAKAIYFNLSSDKCFVDTKQFIEDYSYDRIFDIYMELWRE